MDKRHKLTESEVLEIVERSRKGNTRHEIARRFSVSASTIAFILQGRTWSSVTGLSSGEQECATCGRSFKRGLYRECHGCREKKRKEKAATEGLCTECCLRDPQEGKKHCTECRDRRRERAATLKKQVVDAYGGRCSCCGETNIKFLTIDHKDGDGSEHHKELFGKRTAYRRWWSWIVKNEFPDTLQVLCWNCNCGRAYNGGVCPHHE